MHCMGMGTGHGVGRARQGQHGAEQPLVRKDTPCVVCGVWHQWDGVVALWGAWLAAVVLVVVEQRWL